MYKQRPVFKCEACGHIWLSKPSQWERHLDHPHRCPNCHDEHGKLILLETITKPEFREKYLLK